MDAVTVSPAPATPPVPAREWSELPLDALCVVFAKLGAVELLRGTGSLVCRSWQKATMAPDVWRTVDMMTHHQMLRWTKASGLCAMAKVAVDRADGQLEVFMGSKFVTNQLLTYICDRSPSLKKLFLARCSRVTSDCFTELITKTPLLEHIVVRDCRKLHAGVFEVAGRACPQLKRLELRLDRRFDGRKMALGVAAAMRELRHLTLEGDAVVSGEALAAIVNGCPRLEILDVSDCSGLAVTVGGDLLEECGRLNTVVLPGRWMHE